MSQLLSVTDPSQGSQYVPAAGVGDRDAATIQRPLLGTGPHPGGDRMFSQPSFDMDSGEEGDRTSVPVCQSVKDIHTSRCDVNSVSASAFVSS